jgi:hypothetical protein
MPLYAGVKADPSKAAASRAFECAAGFNQTGASVWLGTQSIDVMNARPHGVTLQWYCVPLP